MNHTIFMLAMLTSQYFEPRFNASLKLLIYQIGMLRSRIDQLKIVPTTEERTELLRLGAELNHDIKGLMFVVKPNSYMNWVYERKKGREWKNVGRKRTPEAVLNLLKRMAQVNPTWGFRRIVGELKKLGIRIGETTTRNALKDMGIFPEPTKGMGKKNLKWKRPIWSPFWLLTSFPRTFGRCGENMTSTIWPSFILKAEGSSVAWERIILTMIG